MSEFTGKLENWNKHQVLEDTFIIWGTIYNDSKERFPDGTRIHTSGIKNRDVSSGDIVRTRNSIYLLGNEARL